MSVIAIAAGTAHTCAILTGNGVKCWGSNGYGQLGIGSTSDTPSPVDVAGHVLQNTLLSRRESRT